MDCAATATNCPGWVWYCLHGHWREVPKEVHGDCMHQLHTTQAVLLDPDLWCHPFLSVSASQFQFCCWCFFSCSCDVIKVLLWSPTCLFFFLKHWLLNLIGVIYHFWVLYELAWHFIILKKKRPGKDIIWILAKIIHSWEKHKGLCQGRWISYKRLTLGRKIYENYSFVCEEAEAYGL